MIRIIFYLDDNPVPAGGTTGPESSADGAGTNLGKSELKNDKIRFEIR